MNPQDLETYWAVVNQVGLLDRTSRARLTFRGKDRANALHNLTTNDIKNLPVNRGCEAFVTSPQGRTLGLVSVAVAHQEILLRADSKGLAILLPHFQKYAALEETTWENTTPSTFEYHLAGPSTDDLLSEIGLKAPGPNELDHLAFTHKGVPLTIIRESLTGRGGATLVGRRAHAEKVLGWLNKAGQVWGLKHISQSAYESLRIEAGTLVFGQDVTPDNLPQELGRDYRTISFQKGCYIGQETVARLDALGHVNKILRGFRFSDGSVPPHHTPLQDADGTGVGMVTSSAFSPGWNQAIGMGFIRVAHAAPGRTLRYDLMKGASGAATVVELPMRPLPGIA